MSYINILNKKNLSFAATLFGLMFFVSDLSGQKFWITTDEFPGGPKVGITVAGDTCIFVALENGIIRSCNEGGSFEQVLKASVTCSIYTTKNGKLMAGGAGRIFYSDNGGQTWDSVMLNSNYPVIQFIENHNGGLFAITGFNPGYVGDGILYSGNAGLSWTQRNNGLGIYRCCERVAIDKNGRLYLAMADKSISGSGGLFISEDNGNTWEHISILVDGKNVVSNQMQVGNTTGLSVSPDDSVYLSFSGVAVNAAVSMNTVKHINDVRSGSFWRNYMITNSNLWWNEKLLNNIYFAGNGDWYSSTIGSIITGATYFKKKKKNVWDKLDYGLGVSKILGRDIQYFAEKPDGKIFMVQFLDERIYKTDTSIITGVEPFPDLSGDIRVYPNPVIKGGEVVIDLTDTAFNRELSVYDYAGKKIYSTFIVRNNFKIIAPDKPGIYFLVINNKHSKSTRRLIVH